MPRSPTVKQAARLAVIANPSVIVVTPRRADWMPLLRHEWVERADPEMSPRGGFLPPLRITPAGRCSRMSADVDARQSERESCPHDDVIDMGRDWLYCRGCRQWNPDDLVLDDSCSKCGGTGLYRLGACDWCNQEEGS